MARVLRSDQNGAPIRPETCDWKFFSGNHCGDVSIWGFGDNFSICEQHRGQLIESHSQIPDFSRRFYRAS